MPSGSASPDSSVAMPRRCLFSNVPRFRMCTSSVTMRQIDVENPGEATPEFLVHDYGNRLVNPS